MITYILPAIIHFIGWTVIDIIIWGKIFERHKLFQYSELYHLGWWISNITMFIPFVIYFWHDKRKLFIFVWTSFVLSFTSIEDIFYYWFDLRAIPEELPWLNINPFIFFKPVTNYGLILNMVIWIIIYILFLFI